MTFETAIALIGFAFVTAISPGPGNFLLMASGANFGFVRTIPLLLGICLGFLIMVLCVGLGLNQILEQNPTIYDLLRIACGIYVLWLAFQIAKSRSLGTDENEKMDKPICMIQGALLQLLNPKAWAVALIVTATYTTPDNFLISLVMMIPLLAITILPSISAWALSGSALRKYLSKGKRIVVFNVSMALLLVASMAPMLINL
ncbi:LysE family translocator [Desulfovibrio sp. JC010]|uniref:LysE family translocator n=1 Tax=Desulfovibrio sp. JC010 TaxID=2593641 RepID=UPI0013D7637E|nr:LysE family translocator [Desulfovibrio sp. JC010]NDV28125.1 LysE family translocator [Desulfovibrio sp. JC010]